MKLLLKKYTSLLFVVIFAINTNAQSSNRQNTNTTKANKYKKYLLLNAGYARRANSFIDIGIHQMVFRDDAQSGLDISGPVFGCEFGILDNIRDTYLPYAGWQGMIWGIGYGLRAEYILRRDHKTLAILPEIGISMMGFLRFMFGYRLAFYNLPEYQFSGFRFSLNVGIPLTSKL